MLAFPAQTSRGLIVNRSMCAHKVLGDSLSTDSPHCELHLCLPGCGLVL